MMLNVILDIPDELSQELSARFDNIGRAACEALASRAYADEVLSLEQVRQMLRLSSTWEAMSVLKQHGVWPGTSVEDVQADMLMLEELRAGAT